LPGMFVRGRVAQGVAEQAISVPPQAVQRNPDGSAYVYVVDQNNTAQIRPIQAGAMMSDKWVVSSGLQAGDRVILNRFQQLRPGAPVKPVPVEQGAGAMPGNGATPGASAPGASAPGAAPAAGEASAAQQTQ